MKKFLLNWASVVIYSLIVLYLSTREITVQVEIKYFDLFVHVVLYVLYAVLMAHALDVRMREDRVKFIVLVIVLATAYGALMEWVQAYVPTRNPSFLDGVANLAGACLGTGFYTVCVFRKKRTEPLKGEIE